MSRLDLLISFEAAVVEEGEENVAYNKDFLACLNRLFAKDRPEFPTRNTF